MIVRQLYLMDESKRFADLGLAIRPEVSGSERGEGVAQRLAHADRKSVV